MSRSNAGILCTHRIYSGRCRLVSVIIPFIHSSTPDHLPSVVQCSLEEPPIIPQRVHLADYEIRLWEILDPRMQQRRDIRVRNVGCIRLYLPLAPHPTSQSCARTQLAQKHIHHLPRIDTEPPTLLIGSIPPHHPLCHRPSTHRNRRSRHYSL